MALAQPLLHIAEIGGSFSWNSSIFTFSASACLVAVSGPTSSEPSR